MKHTVLIIVLFFGSLHFSMAQGHIQYPQEGLYTGFETGMARVFVDGAFDSSNGVIGLNHFTTRDYAKMVISLNLGYGKYIGENFIGVELHHSLYPSKVEESYAEGVFNFDISMSSKSELDLVIGRKIGVRSLLTLRGGLAFTNMDFRAVSFTNESYTLDRKWQGYTLGMGYIYAINDDWALKTKYHLTTIKNDGFSNTDAQVVDNRATLSVIYKLL